MSMTMTAPVQAQTATQPRIGHGNGGGIRGIIKARTGGGGNGNRFSEARTGASPASSVDYKHEKPITQHQRDMEIEEASQHLYAHQVDDVKMAAAIMKERASKTKPNTLSGQKQQTENKRLKTMLYQGQGQRIGANIQNTAMQLMGDQIKGQGIQQSNQINQQRNQLQQGLGMQMLQAMNLQLEATTTRNSNTQELMQLQGLSGNSLPSGNRIPTRSSLQAGRSSLPDIRSFGPGQSGFRRPWAK